MVWAFATIRNDPMLLTRDDLRQQLRKRDFAPVYVLFGAETYLRDLAARTIVDLAFEAGDLRDFNEAVFSLGSADALASALGAARQLPMMSARRVITLTDLRVSATGTRDTLGEDHEATLTAYLDDPSPTTIVIFIADEMNGVRKMGKFLRERTAAVEFTPLDERQFADWTRKTIADAGLTADETAFRALLARVDRDVRRVTNEVNKLAAAAMPEAILTTELVDQLVPNTREIPNFDLTDHLVAGRGRQALSTLKKILDDGAEPVALVGLISYNYRRLLIAKDLMARNAPRSEISSAAKLYGGGQDEFLAAARRADAGRLAHAIKRIAETDIAIKTSIGGSGPTGARTQIEMLVCELAAQ